MLSDVEVLFKVDIFDKNIKWMCNKTIFYKWSKEKRERKIKTDSVE
jgi:hypothetical protein